MKSKKRGEKEGMKKTMPRQQQESSKAPAPKAINGAKIMNLNKLRELIDNLYQSKKKQGRRVS